MSEPSRSSASLSPAGPTGARKSTSPSSGDSPPTPASLNTRAAATAGSSSRAQTDRVNRACDSCRAKKIRCEGKDPCRQCIKRKKPCHFSPLKELTGRPSKVHLGTLQARVKELEEELAAYRKGLPKNEYSEDELASGSEDEAAAEEVGYLSTAFDRARLGQQGDTGSGASDAGLQASRQAAPGANNGFVAGGSEAMSAADFMNGQPSLGPGGPPRSRGADFRPPTWRDPFELISGRGRRPTLAELHWPSAQLERELVDIYFSTIHPAFPVVCEPLFREQLQSSNREALLSDPTFLNIALGVFMLASRYRSADQPPLAGDAASDASQGCSRAGVSWWIVRARLGALEMPQHNSLGSIQHVLLSALYSLNAFTDVHQTWSLFGWAIRSLQDMGAHRERAIAMLGYSSLELEMLRRLWWSVVTFDREFAIGLGRPSAILEGVYDTRYPQVLPQENGARIAPWIAALPLLRISPRASKLDSRPRQAQARAQVMQVFRQWADGLAPELLDLESETDAACLVAKARLAITRENFLLSVNRRDLVQATKGTPNASAAAESEQALRRLAGVFDLLMRRGHECSLDFANVSRCLIVVMTAAMISTARASEGSAQQHREHATENAKCAEVCYLALRANAVRHTVIHGMEPIAAMLMAHLRTALAPAQEPAPGNLTLGFLPPRSPPAFAFGSPTGLTPFAFAMPQGTQPAQGPLDAAPYRY